MAKKRSNNLRLAPGTRSAAAPNAPRAASGRSSAAGPGKAAQPVKGALPGDPDWREVVGKYHPVWRANDLRWRWLMDSLAGGDRYRNGVYGLDRRGLPNRNLVRHNREYPDPQAGTANWGTTGGMMPATGFAGAENALGIADAGAPFGPMPGFPGSDAYATAHDDDYEYRRARTPIPDWVDEASSIHLAKIFDQEVRRDGPDDLKKWWGDVDNRGTSIDDWMREIVAPLHLTLGCLDVCLDHPRPPAGEEVKTRADELRLGLDRCVASYILPQNVVWWRLDHAGRYEAVLIREYADPSERSDHDDGGDAIDPDGDDDAAKEWRKQYVRWRYWTAAESVLLSYDGEEVIERRPHRFGRVPVVRLMHGTDFHEQNLGRSEYEAIAIYQREYYNRDSELILSDTLQAHPLLSGPDDFCKADGTLSIGPGYILPMKKNAGGSGGNVYQGWEFVSPPKDPAESLRTNKHDIRDAADRSACLVKPIGYGASRRGGSGGGGAGHAAQSGISKEMDAHTGHKKLRSIAKSLAKAERTLAEFALIVLRDGAVDRAIFDQVKVVYPARFELRGTQQMAQDALNFQKILGLAGDAPECEAGICKALLRQLLPDLDDPRYEQLDAEIDLAISAKSRVREQYREAGIGVAGTEDDSDVGGDGSDEQAGGTDPLGQSRQTMLSGMAQLAT